MSFDGVRDDDDDGGGGDGGGGGDEDWYPRYARPIIYEITGEGLHRLEVLAHMGMRVRRVVTNIPYHVLVESWDLDRSLGDAGVLTSPMDLVTFTAMLRSVPIMIKPGQLFHLAVRLQHAPPPGKLAIIIWVEISHRPE